MANGFSEHGVTWLKCKNVPMDGARAVVDPKWRCCTHKASRTRDCEYPLCHTPRSISGQEARQWRKNYQL